MSRRWNHPYEDGAPAKSARAQVLSQEVAAARAANHNAKLNQLADEATALKAYFDALRPRALAPGRGAAGAAGVPRPRV